MTAPPPLDLLALPLEGTTLVEASAGTGKTHTIATLFVRLVLERGFTAPQILVVTYTRAATAELRLRIRRRLLEALACFDAADPAAEHDPELSALAQRAREADKFVEGRTRLANALRAFDEAAISTIHGFCQRVLASYSFESGAAFDQTLLEDDRLLIREVVQDFWSNELCDAPEAFVAHLRARRVTTESLALLVERALSHPDVTFVPDREQALRERSTLTELHASYQRCAGHVQALWREQSAAVLALLLDGRFNGNAYKEKNIRDTWAPELHAIAQLPASELPGWFGRLTPAKFGLNKGKQPPSHPFFDACAELEAACGAVVEVLNRELVVFRHALIAYARTELTRRKAQQAELGFDDLLLQLRAALRSERGDSLVARLREAHPAALIDEFQDTDPVQCEIFDRLYAPERHEPGSLLLVGDPKQAIYAFRGADVFAYLVAASRASRVSLPTNYRSDPKLLHALNTLWSRVERPFVWPEIDYLPVAAPSGARERLHGPLGERAPFELLFVPRTAFERDNAKPITKTRLEFPIPKLVAAEVVRTLQSGAWFGADPEGAREPIAPRHIAVLCRTNRQAQRVQAELRRLHVPAVLDGDSSVFDSQMAGELERVMAAMAEPGQATRVRAALATSILGVDGEALGALERSESEWDIWASAFHELCELWQSRGFIRAMHALLDRQHVAKRLLSREDGERRYTDLMHLSELLHAEALRSRSGPLSLLEWLRRMIQGDRERSGLAASDVQIRLESDAQAVTLTTIHKSKGLEYPIVFCPFSWDGSLLRGQDELHPRFHDEAHAQRLTLDLGSENSKAAQPHLERAKLEALSEELRLLYVALTRAKHRVSVVWGVFSEAQASALGYVLHQQSGVFAVPPAERIPKLSDAEYRADLQALVDAAGGAIEVREPAFTDQAPWVAGVSAVPALSARPILRTPQESVRSSSFSRLVAQSELSLPASEGLDRDEAAPIEEPEPLPLERPRVVLADFVAGASFGHLVHSLYEHSDFRAPDAGTLLPAVSAGLTAYGLTTAPADVLARALFESLRTPLAVNGLGLPSLSAIAPEARVNELEFVFPLPEPQAAAPADRQQELFGRPSPKQFSARRLAALLVSHGESALEHAYAERLRSLGFAAVSGFVRGFMDLVVQHDGKYYLIDYKSNHLGEYVEDYAPAKLVHAMFEHHYVLQALIYGVALHRYLKQRLPGYSYAQHFGGVYYLFVRGMSPTHPLGSGVHADRPSPKLIAALDALLDTAGEP